MRRREREREREIETPPPPTPVPPTPAPAMGAVIEVQYSDAQWYVASVTAVTPGESFDVQYEDGSTETIAVAAEAPWKHAQGRYEDTFVAEKIVSHRYDADGGCFLYRVRWAGYTATGDTYEPQENVPTALLEAYGDS